jgi:hypothetical protein
MLWINHAQYPSQASNPERQRRRVGVRNLKALIRVVGIQQCRNRGDDNLRV